MPSQRRLADLASRSYFEEALIIYKSVIQYAGFPMGVI